MQNGSYLSSQKWRNRIANLDVLFGAITLEEVVVWKRLQTRSLPDREAAALGGIRMNEIVAVLEYDL